MKLNKHAVAVGLVGSGAAITVAGVGLLVAEKLAAKKECEATPCAEGVEEDGMAPEETAEPAEA